MRSVEASSNFFTFKQFVVLDALGAAKERHSILEDQLALGEIAVQNIGRRIIFAAPR